MDLQLFAGDDADDVELFLNRYDDGNPTDEYGEPIPESTDTETETDKPEGETETETETPEAAETETPPTTEEQPEPDKKVQSPEENARFAEMRRQKETQERVERETQARLQATPEYQMAQILAQQYGMTPEQLLGKMQEAALQRQAQQQGVPVEVLQQIQQERQARAELEQRLNKTEFENWMNTKQTEMATIKTKYPGVLTDDDLTEAMTYQLDTLKNPALPLEKVVFALHGDKITANLRQTAKQEALAEISGRKQGALPPQGNKAAATDSGLSAEERSVARKMGISEADYAKSKAEIE